MSEVSQFFRPVRDFCAREVVTCHPGDALVEVVSVMREKSISSVIVVAGGEPAGIFTDRDLRNKVVAAGIDPRTLRVSDVMHAPLAVIAEDDPLYQALYQMSRQRIHRLGVVDATGRLAGIVTDTDILRLQAHSPQQLVLDIEAAQNLEELKALHARIQALVLHLSGTGIAVRGLLRLIAHLNDQIVLRLIGLLRADAFADLPDDGFAFLVLGSEGRGEQTLATDQDNAIVHADDLTAEQVRRIEEFAQALIDGLLAIGVPACPGGIMASNPTWRRSLGAWRAQLDAWLSTPTPDNILACGTFVDLRTLYGNPEFERRLKTQLYEHATAEPLYLMRMVENCLRFTPPLGWFGKVKGESGEHTGQIDIKKAGIFALTDGVKALAIENRRLDGSSSDRFDALRADGVLPPVEAEGLAESFDFLVQMRLRCQVAALREGRVPDNYVTLERLNAMEQAQLRIALAGVEKFQVFLKHHFKLHLMR